MSHMIQCDACGKTMYADSRSEKGDYHELWIDGSNSYHVCRDCYDLLMRTVFHCRFDEDEQQYVKMEEAQDG